jgi:CheY-like chemotaxis protein
VVNARDAISEVGSITLRTENVVVDDSNRAENPEFIPGEYVLLIVSDTGAGMSQEVRENIFEPFFTTKELGKGTGLGLSTVYGIVKQNDGLISVASELGKGTSFKISLPRLEDETAQPPSEDVAFKRPTGTETILLVEDDEAILDLSKTILENLGYTVLEARTPAHAIHLVKGHPGDLHLLITDVVMPEMNGRELAEQFGAIQPNLKCLYMSVFNADVITLRGILNEGIQEDMGNCFTVFLKTDHRPLTTVLQRLAAQHGLQLGGAPDGIPTTVVLAHICSGTGFPWNNRTCKRRDFR